MPDVSSVQSVTISMSATFDSDGCPCGAFSALDALRPQEKNVRLIAAKAAIIALSDIVITFKGISMISIIYKITKKHSKKCLKNEKM